MCLLFVKQNIAYRSHQEGSKYIDDPNYNSGNYQDFLRFIAENRNEVLRLPFENDARNAKYRSQNIRNELINILAVLLRSEIVKEMTRAKFFSIMADEAADVGVKEQLSLVIRFVGDKSNIREELNLYIVRMAQVVKQFQMLCWFSLVLTFYIGEGRVIMEQETCLVKIKVLLGRLKIGLGMSLPDTSIKSMCC